MVSFTKKRLWRCLLSPRLLLSAACIVISTTKASYAYLDPGAGTIMLQVIVGALSAVTLTWHRIKSAVARFISKPPTKS